MCACVNEWNTKCAEKCINPQTYGRGGGHTSWGFSLFFQEEFLSATVVFSNCTLLKTKRKAETEKFGENRLLGLQDVESKKGAAKPF